MMTAETSLPDSPRSARIYFKAKDSVQMENEFMRRGFLLPEGCKDLIDALRLKPQTKLHSLPAIFAPPAPSEKLLPLPFIIGEISMAAMPMSVRQLAELLKQKPFEIIGDLMELG